MTLRTLVLLQVWCLTRGSWGLLVGFGSEEFRVNATVWMSLPFPQILQYPSGLHHKCSLTQTL